MHNVIHESILQRLQNGQHQGKQFGILWLCDANARVCLLPWKYSWLKNLLTNFPVIDFHLNYNYELGSISVCAPTLFIICINGLLAVTSTYTHSYADDSLLYSNFQTRNPSKAISLFRKVPYLSMCFFFYILKVSFLSLQFLPTVMLIIVQSATIFNLGSNQRLLNWTRSLTLYQIISHIIFNFGKCNASKTETCSLSAKTFRTIAK